MGLESALALLAAGIVVGCAACKDLCRLEMSGWRCVYILLRLETIYRDEGLKSLHQS